MSETRTRRRFLGETLMALAVTPLAGAACGDDDNGDEGDCDGVGARSSVDAGHDHFVCVPSTDLTSPPTSSATYRTTDDDGHTHDVTLSAADLDELAGGGSVTVTSSLDDGHTHQFVLAQRD